MKRHFLFTLAALALLTGCNADKLIDEAPRAAIGFKAPFLENVTRSIVDPSLTSGQFGFTVWAYNITNGAKIMDGVDVDKSGNYSPTQYWVAEQDYVFGAVAPEDKGWASKEELDSKDCGWYLLPESLNINGFDHATWYFINNGEIDFAAGETEASTKNNTYPEKITLNFSHLLSKVKFNFTNNCANDYSLKVTDIQMSGLLKKAKLVYHHSKTTDDSGNEIDQYANDFVWDHKDNTGATYGLTLNFGNAVKTVAEGETQTADASVIAKKESVDSYHVKFLVPEQKEYNVSFKVTVLSKDGTELLTDVLVNGKVNLDMAEGYAYVINASLSETQLFDTTHHIVFDTAIMGGWDDSQSSNNVVFGSNS